jgi:hypothetical protein
MKSDGKDEKNGSVRGLVEDLVEFTTSPEYSNRIKEFFVENCEGFHDYEERQRNGQGNRLEWSEIFSRYLEVVDEQLDKFCQLNSSAPSDVYESVREYVDSNHDEFIPLFLKSFQEQNFFQQMSDCALESNRALQATEKSAGEQKGEESLSGMLLVYA